MAFIMGIILGLIIPIILIFIVSSIIALISGFLTYFLSNNKKKKRKIFIAVVAPFQILYSFFLTLLIGGLIISETKNIDIGIGDSWYVPLNDSCEIFMIDITDKAFLKCNEETLLSNITELQLTNNKVYGKTNDSEYFSLNLNNNITQHYLNENDLKESENLTVLNLQRTEDFYNNRKWELTKFWIIIALILATFFSVFGFFILYKIALYKWKLNFNKKKTTTNTG
ncbi:hypothetical protein [Formosa sp. A9]|uniref:hypothetical protein n=1 Tax=Formosa sp. A9 TaxID=3442641 RepID=UPI003EBB9B2E